jgi:hypothetical protein
LILKKLVDEYEEVRKNMNEASRKAGRINPVVLEYSRRLDELHNLFLSLRFNHTDKDDLAS